MALFRKFFRNRSREREDLRRFVNLEFSKHDRAEALDRLMKDHSL